MGGVKQQIHFLQWVGRFMGTGMDGEKEVERAMGIEPTALAWEARVLPLYDARM